MHAVLPTQVDVGFGDAVTPGPTDAVYPVLLDELPAPRLRTYPVYTVVAEKLHAIVVLGMVNGRLKDYLDLVVIMEREALDEPTLALAIAATFQRRGTALPNALPVGLSDEFALDPTRIALWQSLLSRPACGDHRSAGMSRAWCWYHRGREVTRRRHKAIQGSRSISTTKT